MKGQNRAISVKPYVARSYVSEGAAKVVRTLTKSGAVGGTAKDAKNAKDDGRVGGQQTANGNGGSLKGSDSRAQAGGLGQRPNRTAPAPRPERAEDASFALTGLRNGWFCGPVPPGVARGYWLAPLWG